MKPTSARSAMTVVGYAVVGAAVGAAPGVIGRLTIWKPGGAEPWQGFGADIAWLTVFTTGVLLGTGVGVVLARRRARMTDSDTASGTAIAAAGLSVAAVCVMFLSPLVGFVLLLAAGLAMALLVGGPAERGHRRR